MAKKTVFVIPKITAQLGGKEVFAQIKYLGEGIFEEQPLVPVLTYWGKFPETSSEDFSITKDKNNSRIDITSFIEYSLRYEGISKLDLSDIDIKLFVDLKNEMSKDLKEAQVEWTEIEPGWFNYNNNLTYGYRWRVEQEQVGNRFNYYLVSDTPNNGIRVISDENQPPVLPVGLTWKLVIAKKEHMTRQFDLIQLFTSFVADSVITNLGEYTSKPISGKAVYEYLKNDLVLQKLSVGSDPQHPGTLHLLLTDKASDNVIKGSIQFFKNKDTETAVLELDEGKLTLVDEELKNLSDTEFKKQFNEYDFIPRRVLDIHEKQKITNLIGVHGIKQGFKNNFNADMVDGVRLGKPGYTMETDLDTKSNFVPYVDSDNIFSVGNVVYYYIKNADNSYKLVKTVEVKENNKKEVQEIETYQTSNYITKETRTKNPNKTLKQIINPNALGSRVENVVRTLKSDNSVIDTSKLSIVTFGDWFENLPETNGIYKEVKYLKYKNSIFNSETALTTFLESEGYHLGSEAVEDTLTPQLNSAAVCTMEVIKIDQTVYTDRDDYTTSVVEVSDEIETLRQTNDIVFAKDEDGVEMLATLVAQNFNIPSSEAFKVDENGGKEFVEIPNVLQMFGEIPYFTYKYANEYKAYGSEAKIKTGLIIEKMEAAMAADSLNGKYIFTNGELGVQDNKNLYKFDYTEDEKARFEKFSQALLDGKTVNANNSIGLIMAALSEASNRLLRIESSVEGVDADSRPGVKEEITGLASDINKNPLKLGLNRVVRALAKEIFDDANPLATSSNIFTDNSLSRIDRLDKQVNGENASNVVEPDNKTFILLNEALGITYPKTIEENSEELRKYYFDYEGSVLDPETLNEFKNENLTAGDVGKLYFDGSIVYEAKYNPDTNKYIYAEKESPYFVKKNFDELPTEKLEHIIVCLPNGKEYVVNENNWTIYSQIETVKLNEDKWDGLNDAVNRIAIKLNELTEAVYGSDNIKSKPQRLETIRKNIQTLIKDAYGKDYEDLDGESSAPYTELSTKLNSKNDYMIDELWSNEIPFIPSHQNLNDKTFNGKSLKISETDLAQATSHNGLSYLKPLFIETQEDLNKYASIIDVLIEIVGKNYLVKYNPVTGDNSRELVRLQKDLSNRVLDIEIALDSLSEKIIGKKFEELKKDTNPELEFLRDSTITQTSNDVLNLALINIQTFCERILRWVGITPVKAVEVTTVGSNITLDSDTLTFTLKENTEAPDYVSYEGLKYIKVNVTTENGVTTCEYKKTDDWKNVDITNYETLDVKSLISRKEDIQHVIEKLYDDSVKYNSQLSAIRQLLGTSRYPIDGDKSFTVETDIVTLMKKIFGNSFTATSGLKTTDFFAKVIGDLYKKNYKNIDTKAEETPVEDIAKINDPVGAADGLTTSMIVKLRDELSRLRQFIGYNQIDTSADGKTGQYDFNPKAYENIFGYQDQVQTDDSGNKQVKTLLDYIYLIVQKDLSQDENDKDFEKRVAANTNKIDQILGWLEDKKDEDGTVTAQGILSQVETLWKVVTDNSTGLTKKVENNTDAISNLKTLIDSGWSEGEGFDTVSYQGYKALIKDIYDQLADGVTATVLINTLENYHTKTEAENKFVAQVAGKGLSTKDYTEEDAKTVSELRKSSWVKPVDGKGLSTEDFTTELKNKLDGIDAKADKTEITSTLNDSETTVPSNKAVSTGLSGKVAKTDTVKTIDSSNNTASDKVPSCAAVTAYIDSKISGAMDFTVTPKNNTISIANSTEGLCAVRVTKMSDGSVQYKSNITLGNLGNKTTAFKFNIETSANYMIEAWYYNTSTKKLVPTAVKYV